MSESLTKARQNLARMLEIYAPLGAPRNNAMAAMNSAIAEFEAAVRDDEAAITAGKLSAESEDDHEKTKQKRK